MRKVSRSALVTHSAGNIFALVDDIEAYPDFLPWCNDTEVHRREGDVVEASIELHHSGLSRHFRTRNTSVHGEKIDIALVGGPFRDLSGGWRFVNLGESGCKVMLEMEFAFANPLVDLVLGAFFEETCNSLVDAFTQRADVVYGKS